MRLWDRFRLRVLRVPPLLWAAGMVVVVVALGLSATQIDVVARADAAVLRELQGEVAVRGVEEHVFTVTDLGGSPMLLIGVLIVIALLITRHWRAALCVTLAVTATKITVALLKELVERERPQSAFASHDTFSFPSGHAASAAALYMSFSVLMSRGRRGIVRASVLLLGALLTFAIGSSRVLLGAHFPTDVLAGWLVGGILAIASWTLVARLAEPAVDDRSQLAHALVEREPQRTRLPEDVPL